MVASAGDEADDAAFYSPDSCGGVINVGAVSRVGERSDSNYGRRVDIPAPGGDVDPDGLIISTHAEGDTSPGDYGYTPGTTRTTSPPMPPSAASSAECGRCSRPLRSGSRCAPPGGSCRDGTLPVFRFFNGRRDANQRLTIDLSVRRAMSNRAWVADRIGANGAAMCSLI